MKRFELGFGLALFLAIAGSVTVCGILVHLTWSRTAEFVSRDLLGALERQISTSARKSWWERVEATETLANVVVVGLQDNAEPSSQERIMAAALRNDTAAPTVVFIRPDGTSTLFNGLPDAAVSMLVRDKAGEPMSMARFDAKGERAASPIPAQPDLRGPAAGFSWLAAARKLEAPGWLLAPDLAGLGAGQGNSESRAVAFVQNTAQGTLAFVLTFERFRDVLAEIPVSRTGRLVVLTAEGSVLVNSRASGQSGMPDDVAGAAGKIVAARPADAKDVAQHHRVLLSDNAYAVTLSPLFFRGWQLAVIVPEADFLDDIEKMLSRVTLGLAVFVLVVGFLASFITRMAIARPMESVVADLALVERFDLEAVPRRHSPLREIDQLSAAIYRMSRGLADFAKFIPTELVRRLISEGMRAEPGGSQRDITVLFADLAGFTRLTEALGDDAVPIVSAFLDLASQEVAATGGTVDKFIGDAVMAFWGAPAADLDHARHGCEAALRILERFEALRASDARFSVLSVRIGLQSGKAIVGNVGSAARLNYTALGDVVNLASRLEGVNKIYGTQILMAQETADRVIGQFTLREVDTVTVYGRRSDVTLIELLPNPGRWIETYLAALQSYRQRDFGGALQKLAELEKTRPFDGPAQRLRDICRKLDAAGVPEDWQPVNTLEVK